MSVEAPPFVKPLYLSVPERVGSFGDEAIDVARIAGRELDAEQCAMVDAFLSYKAGGRWAALEQCIIEARQNGKTFAVLETVVMYDLWFLPPDKIAWTAQRFHTAHDAFKDFDLAIASTPELSRRVKKILYGGEDLSIELHSGARLEFLARSSGGGRGLGGKRTVFDEALILSGAAMGSLMPILSARDDPQLTYGASACLLGSDHLRSLQKRGRSGGDPSLIYVEYADDGSWEDPPCEQGKDCSHLYGVAGCALDDESRWHRANHTLGRRPIDGGTGKHGITLDYVRAERRTLPALEFGRERLGWGEYPPDEGEDGSPFDMARWATLADPQAPKPEGEVALAVEVPPDRSSTSVAAAWWLGERVMVMVTEVAGTTRSPALVKALCDKHDIVDTSLHAGGPAGGLLERLEHEGVETRAVSTTESAQATQAFLDLVNPPKPDEFGVLTDEKLLGHLDQTALTSALEVSRLRNVGDGSVLDRKDPLGNVAPAFAALLAVHGLMKHSKPPAPFFGAWR